MLLTPKILNELWRRAQASPLGLRLHVTSTDYAVKALRDTQPPDMANFTIARTDEPDIIFLIAPGVTLEGVPLDPNQPPDLT